MIASAASLGITHRELDHLLEQYRVGAMTFGSEEHQAFVESAIEYLPRLVAIAREVVPGELLAEVHIPGFLPRGSKNIREHYMARKRRVAKERQVVTVALLAGARHLRDKGDKVGRVEIIRQSVRLLDSDNCTGSLAATRDAVAEFLGVNDGDPRIRWTTGQSKVKRAGVGVVIRVEQRTREAAE